VNDAPDAPNVPASPPLLKAIAARRSLRAFADRPVSDDLLRILFEAVRWAPSSGNGQPWRFVVTRKGSEAHARLAATLRSGNAWATRAPVLMLAAVKTVHDSPGKPVRANRRALLDLGLGLENLLLQASAEGLVGHPMAGFDADAASLATGVEGEHQVAVMVALGYPGDPSTLDDETRAKDLRERRRDRQDAFVFLDAWGAPAPWAAQVRAEPAGDDARQGAGTSPDGRSRPDGGSSPDGGPTPAAEPESS